MEPNIDDRGSGGGGSGSQPTGERVARELPGLVPSTPSPPCTNATSIAAINAGFRDECGAQAWMNTGAGEHDTASVSDVVIQIEDDDEVQNKTQNRGKKCKDTRPTAQFSKRWAVINWVKSKFTKDKSTPPNYPQDGYETDVPRIFWIRENASKTSAGETSGDKEGRAERHRSPEWVPVPFNSNETLRLDDDECKSDGYNYMSTAHSQSHVPRQATFEGTFLEGDPELSEGVLPMDTSEIFRRAPGSSFFDTITMKNIQRRICSLGQQDTVKQPNREESFAKNESPSPGLKIPASENFSSSQEQDDIREIVQNDRNRGHERNELPDTPVLRTDLRSGEPEEPETLVTNNVGGGCVLVTYSSNNTAWVQNGTSGRLLTFGEGIDVVLLSRNETLTDDSTLRKAFIIRRNGKCEQKQIRIEGGTPFAGTENDSGVGESQDLIQGHGVVETAETNNSSILNEGNVKIQTEDEDTESSELSDSPIKMYMDAMYYLCASPFKLDGDSSSLVQKVLYTVVFVVSTIYGLQLVKDQILLADRAKQKLGFYVYLAYYVNALLFPLYFKYLAHRKTDIFKDIARFRTQGWKRLIKVIIVFSIGSSIATAAYQPVSRMNYVFDDWDAEDMILVYSQRTSYAVFIWNPSNVTNAKAALNKQYGYGSEEVTPVIIGMGVVGLVVEFLGITALNLIRDIPLFCAITLLLRALDFVSVLRNATRGNVVDLLPQIWKKYNQLRDFSLKIKRLNVLFQFLHLDNMLFFSYALYDRLIVGENKSSLVYQICRGMKSLSFYLVAAKDACVNPTFRRWIQTTSRHTNVVFNADMIPISGASVIEEITTDPIGVGSNMWFVDQSFVWKFFSYVGSSFFFFVESHDDDDDND